MNEDITPEEQAFYEENLPDIIAAGRELDEYLARQVKPNWSLPKPPDGFDIAVAFYYSATDVELDWTRKDRRDFASEYPELDGQGVIEWPFVEGYDPTTTDWKNLGVMKLW